MHPNDLAANSTSVADGEAELGVQSTAAKTFRLRLIPATFSYFIGYLFLLGIPFGMYVNWDSMKLDANEDLPLVLSSLLFVAYPLFILLGAVLMIFGGRCWYRGQWVTALLSNGVAMLLLQGVGVAREYLSDWANSMIN